MAFEAFTQKTSSGAFHQRRAIAYASAACVLVGLGLASAKMNTGNGAEPMPAKEPDPVDVVFEEKIEEEKPKEPEPPPPAQVVLEVPQHVKISAEPPPPPPKEPDPDVKAKLDEADPSKDKGVAGGAHEGDPSGVAGAPQKKKDEPPPCGGEGQACCAGSCSAGLECTSANVCKKPAPPAPPPKPKAQLVSEDDVPAKGLSTPPPAYPAAARSAGIQGAVVVRLTIDEGGTVIDAKIVKGDPNFDEVVLPAVKAWKYEPARHQDGKPFLSIKTVKIPFKIKM